MDFRQHEEIVPIYGGVSFHTQKMDTFNVNLSWSQYGPQSNPVSSEVNYWNKVSRTLLCAYPPFIVLIGTVGNIITLIILRRPKFRSSSLSVGLRFMCVMDTLVLWTVVSLMWVRGITRIDFLSMSVNVCLIHQMYTSVTTTIINWVLVLITATRLVHIRSPFQVYRICSRKTYYICLSAICCTSFGIYAVSYVTGKHGLPSNKASLDVLSEYSCALAVKRRFMQLSGAYGITDMLFFFILPGLFLVSLNFVILGLYGEVRDNQRALLETRVTQYYGKLFTLKVVFNPNNSFLFFFFFFLFF
ncbi:uncharacterized protein LOC101845210 [Aplysia californica]|uniref:Uncharacterized protein LOC101845210 n=1 Tax=Aplysia californica TaxID=6500 RepID=A0ABM0JCM2_APLCA|nr:uncharacterized protein LOC101845210 [Aplysia californica]